MTDGRTGFDDLDLDLDLDLDRTLDEVLVGRVACGICGAPFDPAIGVERTRGFSAAALIVATRRQSPNKPATCGRCGSVPCDRTRNPRPGIATAHDWSHHDHSHRRRDRRA